MTIILNQFNQKNSKEFIINYPAVNDNVDF